MGSLVGIEFCPQWWAEWWCVNFAAAN